MQESKIKMAERVLHSVYDLSRSPITFDYANFLVLLEIQRQALGLDSINLTISASRRRKLTPRELVYSDDFFRWRILNLIQPVSSLLPSLESFTVSSAPIRHLGVPSWPVTQVGPEGVIVESIYSIGVVQQLGIKGVKCRPFRAPDHAADIVASRFGDLTKCVTITLRTSTFQAERNSDLENWFEIHSALIAKGYKTIIIPDVEDLWGNNAARRFDWELATDLSYNMPLRMAVYEKSLLNLCVNNGAAALLLYSDAPYVMTKLLVPEVPTTSVNYHREVTKLERGANFSFATDRQELYWGGDGSSELLDFISRRGLL
jgi:hypothetical protein